MIRYAILTSVSTPEQAHPDKISLTYQQNACRTAAAAQGWRETAGPFVVDGYSRSSYVNLSDAERDIPPLRAALEAARAEAFDVLVIYTYDRLGDLTTLIASELRTHRKQLYSVTQPSIVQDPSIFDPYTNESADLQLDAARIIQRFRINDLRRKWRAGVPARLAKGLTPLRIPFGYRWQGKKEPPVLNEQQAALIYQMKDMLFAGASFNQIAQHCTESQVPTPNGGNRWDISSIAYILANPYYTGQVTLHKTRNIHDATRKNKYRPILQPIDSWETGKGKHQPLWDVATHREILRELERRHEINKAFGVRFPLSGLLTCSICGQKLNRRSHSSGVTRRSVFACRVPPSHVIMPYDDVMKIVSYAIHDALKEQQANPPAPRQDPINTIQISLNDLNTRRKRVQMGFESGLYTPAEAAERLAEIDGAIEQTRRQLQQTAQNAETAATFRATITGLDLERIPEWIATDNPATVNRTLNAICKKIDLTPDGDVVITFR